MANKKVMLDANAVLRFVLHDNEKQFSSVVSLINNENCYVSLEVIAEIVYVLDGVYEVPRAEISSILKRLGNDITILNSSVLFKALDVYTKKPKIDFVDCLMVGYSEIANYEIFSFDKKLNKVLSREKED